MPDPDFVADTGHSSETENNRRKGRIKKLYWNVKRVNTVVFMGSNWKVVSSEPLKEANLELFFLKFILGKMLLLKVLLVIFDDVDCRFR